MSCQGCHDENYTDWSLSGHAHALKKIVGGSAPSYPFSSVPNPPSGFSWSGVTYVPGGYAWKANFIDSSGYVITGASRQYNLASAGFSGFLTGVSYPPGRTYDDSCARCHATGWCPSATAHQDGLPGIQGTWSEAGVGCEACHRLPNGTGIVLDNSAAMCGTCHCREDGGRVEVEGGLIKNYEQYDELQNGPMGSHTCQDCHDPHKNTVYGGGGVVIDNLCRDCHPSRVIRPIGGHADLVCTDCHMPPVAKSALQSGSGDYLYGDVCSHTFRIDRTRDPAEMFYSASGRTYFNGFLAVNYACLYCHNGTDACLLTVANAKINPLLNIHEP